MRISLLPLGSPGSGLLYGLADGLAKYGIVGSPLPLEAPPADAFDPVRRQFRAEDVLPRIQRPGANRVLAVTGEDLFAEGRKFVFGFAMIGGSTAVVSVHRLVSMNEDATIARLVKESVHELGHLYGLAHCERPGCVMGASNSAAEVDLKGNRFCETCGPSVPFSGTPRGSPL